jgi:hypothetical protein
MQVQPELCRNVVVREIDAVLPTSVLEKRQIDASLLAGKRLPI